jgi:hypothetical protein
VWRQAKRRALYSIQRPYGCCCQHLRGNLCRSVTVDWVQTFHIMHTRLNHLFFCRQVKSPKIFPSNQVIRSSKCSIRRMSQIFRVRLPFEYSTKFVKSVRSQLVTDVITKKCYVTSCSLVEINGRFGWKSHLHL